MALPTFYPQMALPPQSVPVKTLVVGLLGLLIMGRFGFQKGKPFLGDLGRGSGDGSCPDGEHRHPYSIPNGKIGMTSCSSREGEILGPRTWLLDRHLHTYRPAPDADRPRGVSHISRTSLEFKRPGHTHLLLGAITKMKVRTGGPVES
jgi:hypothetical protein